MLPRSKAQWAPPESSIPRKRPAETQEEAWVADEDRFVLRQAKKKATLRVRAGRSRPIDLLAVTLRTIDPARNGMESDDEDEHSLAVNPESVFEDLDEDELVELEKGIDTYLALEKSKSNQEFWNTMKLICKDKRQTQRDQAPSARGISSVSAELDRVLGPKTLGELEALEKQVKHKLRSDEDIDVDYWETLLKRLSIHKAKAKLRNVSQSVTSARLENLRRQQQQEALRLHQQLQAVIPLVDGDATQSQAQKSTMSTENLFLDPEPYLKLSTADKTLQIQGEAAFSRHVLQERRKVLKAGYVHSGLSGNKTSGASQALVGSRGQEKDSKGDHSHATSTLYEREVARGVGENEEVFAGEEEVTSTRQPAWADTYKPRKPRYFNRVQIGYEWNKYNQTHYDQDNPPPKVVQGYKFNVFYPDLIDKTKAPTYRIERENGRKRGQSFAPAGEEDSCLIRFIAGPPYEDLAFRIADREWDYSAKRERGFKSSFDKGILQLHFQFKKIYYRK